MLFFKASFIIKNPGSEIQGVPESDTRQTFIPAFKIAIISYTFSASVNLFALINSPLLFFSLDSEIFSLIYLMYSLSIP